MPRTSKMMPRRRRSWVVEQAGAWLPPELNEWVCARNLDDHAHGLGSADVIESRAGYRTIEVFAALLAIESG